MADEKSDIAEQCTKTETNSNFPEQPRSPGAKSSNGDHEYVMLANPDVESDSGSAVSFSSMDKSKSLGSSVSSFADVIIPDMEATLEKGPTDEEVQNLVEDAKKDISHGTGSLEGANSDHSTMTDTQKALQGSGNMEDQSHARNSPLLEDCQLSNQMGDDKPSPDLVRQCSSSASEAETTQATTVASFSSGESARTRANAEPVHSGHSDDESDDNAVIFDGVTYLGSSTVNAPVSEIELKRTMSVLREQTEVTIDVLLYVGSTSDSMIRLKDPETQGDIATYRIQRILFCGRGDAEGGERDCFAFNTVHGDSDIFHCHVFRCVDPEKVNKIKLLLGFSYSSLLSIFIWAQKSFLLSQI